MFECARSFWVIARAYAKLSDDFETLEDYENATIAMVQCSKAYKAAAVFSAASTNQNEIGISLISENLEFKSEQARIFAQNIVAFKEEKQGNLLLASKLYSGLSMLSKRLLFLKNHDDKQKNLIKAQYNFDMGKACHLRAHAILKRDSYKSDKKTAELEIEPLQKKANYYFSRAEEIWEDLLVNEESILEEEKENLKFNLSIVNENIMENDVEILAFEEVKDIIDPEPAVVIPENITPILPKTILYLTKFTTLDVNVKLYRKYKHKKLQKRYPENKKRELLHKKAGIGRTIKELKNLYENNDLDLNRFVELIEKYSTEIAKIEFSLDELDKADGKMQVDKIKKDKTKRINQ
jgi:hypothetical protein